MFNRTVILAEQRTKFIDRDITIHEHRAPTDESLKLLREMEQKVRDEVLASFKLENTTVSCYFQVIRAPDFTPKLSMRAIMNINGRNHKAEVELEKFEVRTPEDAGKLMREAMIKVIVEYMVDNLDMKKSSGYEHFMEFFKGS